MTRGFGALSEAWVRAGRGVHETSWRLADEIDVFCGVVGGQPFGSDDLGRGLFEGNPGSGATGFVQRRDSLLKDLPAMVNLLRGVGTGLAKTGRNYSANEEAIIEALGGRRGPAAPSRSASGDAWAADEYALPPIVGGRPSAAPPPDVVRQALWLFEQVGLGFSWPDGNLAAVGAMGDGAAGLCAVIDEMSECIPHYAGWVTGSGFGEATDAFAEAARMVSGEEGLLTDLRQRCEDLATYCRASGDAIVTARWHFVCSAVYAVTLMYAVSALGPLLGVGIGAMLSWIRIEGEALQIILRLLFESVVGGVFSVGSAGIDLLFQDGHRDWGKLVDAFGQGLMLGGLMGGARAGLPALLRRGPATSRLAAMMGSEGAAGILSRFAVGWGVGTGAIAVTNKITGHGWDLEHAWRTGLAMASIGSGGEAITRVRNLRRSAAGKPSGGGHVRGLDPPVRTGDAPAALDQVTPGAERSGTSPAEPGPDRQRGPEQAGSTARGYAGRADTDPAVSGRTKTGPPDDDGPYAGAAGTAHGDVVDDTATGSDFSGSDGAQTSPTVSAGQTPPDPRTADHDAARHGGPNASLPRTDVSEKTPSSDRPHGAHTGLEVPASPVQPIPGRYGELASDKAPGAFHVGADRADEGHASATSAEMATNPFLAKIFDGSTDTHLRWADLTADAQLASPLKRLGDLDAAGHARLHDEVSRGAFPSRDSFSAALDTALVSWTPADSPHALRSGELFDGFFGPDPVFMTKGGENLVYQAGDNVVKVDHNTAGTLLGWRKMGWHPEDVRTDEAMTKMTSIAEERSRRYQALKDFHGPTHVIPESVYVRELEWPGRIVKDLVTDKSHVDPDRSYVLPTLITTQRKINGLERIRNPDLSTGYSETADKPGTEQYVAANQRWLELRGPADFDPQLFLSVQRSPSIGRIVHMLQSDPAAQKAVRTYVRNSIAYTEHTDEIMDTVGAGNVVFIDSRDYVLVDALHPYPPMTLTAAIAALHRLGRGEELNRSDKICLLNVLNYVRTLNGLASATGLPERIDIVPQPFNADSWERFLRLWDNWGR